MSVRSIPQDRGLVGLYRTRRRFRDRRRTDLPLGDRDVRLVVQPAATLVVRAVDAATGETVRRRRRVRHASRRRHAAGDPAWARRARTSNGPTAPRGGNARAAPNDAVQPFAKGRFASRRARRWSGDPRDGELLVLPLVAAADRDGAGPRGRWDADRRHRGVVPAATEAAAGPPVRGMAIGSAARGHTQLQVNATTRWARDGVDDAARQCTRAPTAARRCPFPRMPTYLVAALGPGHLPAAIVGRPDAAEIELRVDAGATVHLEVLAARTGQKRFGPAKSQVRLQSLGAKDVVARGATIWVQHDRRRPGTVGRTSRRSTSICSACCTRSGLAAAEALVLLTNYMGTRRRPRWHPDRAIRSPRVTLRDGEERTVPVDLSARWRPGLRGRVLVNGEPWLLGSGQLLASRHSGPRRRRERRVHDRRARRSSTSRCQPATADTPVLSEPTRQRGLLASGGTGARRRRRRHRRGVHGALRDRACASWPPTASQPAARRDHGLHRRAEGLAVVDDDADGWITIELTHTSPFTPGRR